MFLENHYNIDIKEFTIDFFGMFCIICPKYEKDTAIAEAQNQE